MKTSIIRAGALALGFFATSAMADVVGEWETDCTMIKEGGVKVYLTDYYNLAEDGTFTQENAVYQDKKCTKLFILNTFEGSYTTAAGANGMTNVDFTLEKHYFTFSALLKPAMAIFNKDALCGYTDWDTDVKKEVTGRKCELNVLGKTQEFPTLQKAETIYTIASESNGEMQMGLPTEDLDGSSADKRPDSLNKDMTYLIIE